MQLSDIAASRAAFAGQSLVLPNGIAVPFENTASADVDEQNGFTPLCPTELPVQGGTEIVDESNANAGVTSRRYGGGDYHPEDAVWITEEPSKIATPLNKEAIAAEHPGVDLSHVDVYWPAHCMDGTFGAEQLEGLPRPEEYDFFARKGTTPFRHGYSDILDALISDEEFLEALSRWQSGGMQGLFHEYSTGMIEDMLIRGVQVVVSGGLATNYCVRATENHLLLAGLYVIHNDGAARGLFPEGDDTVKEAMFEEIRRGYNGDRYFVVKSADEIRAMYRQLTG